MVFASAVMLGIAISLHFKKREEILEKTLLFIKNIKTDLSYSNLPLGAIIEKYAKNEYFSSPDFLSLCLNKIKDEEDIPDAWKESVEAEKLFSKREKEKLISLGMFLGSSGLDEQLNMLELYENYFQDFYSKAHENTQKYSKTAIITGTFLGFGIFVLAV